MPQGAKPNPILVTQLQILVPEPLQGDQNVSHRYATPIKSPNCISYKSSICSIYNKILDNAVISVYPYSIEASKLQ